jgi:hypothetical protein
MTFPAYSDEMEPAPAGARIAVRRGEEDDD